MYMTPEESLAAAKAMTSEERIVEMRCGIIDDIFLAVEIESRTGISWEAAYVVIGFEFEFGDPYHYLEDVAEAIGALDHTPEGCAELDGIADIDEEMAAQIMRCENAIYREIDNPTEQNPLR